MSNSPDSSEDFPDVTVNVELTDPQALALSQLVKRFGFSDAEGLAVDRNEASVMIDAITRLQRALDDVGYSPR